MGNSVIDSSDKVEDLLCDYIYFGHDSEKSRNGLHVPSLWEVCHDLQQWLWSGLLIEISVNCSLDDIYQAQRSIFNKTFDHKILDQLYDGDDDWVIQFRTVPGNTIYELRFGTYEYGMGTLLEGTFKKIKNQSKEF